MTKFAKTHPIAYRRTKLGLQIALNVAVVALPALAMAAGAQPNTSTYPGQGLLEFAAKYIIAPLGLFSILAGLGAAFFRPEYVKQAIYSAIICAVLFFIIYNATDIMKAFAK